MAETKKHAGGRPTKYKKEYAEYAKKLGRHGLIDTDYAELFGVAIQTIYTWKKNHPEFLEALNAGKQEADSKVEKALFELATGYEYDAEKPMIVSDGKDVGSHIEVANYREKIAPNATAIIYWLKNRQPEKWRDKQEIEHSGEVHLSFDKDDERL